MKTITAVVAVFILLLCLPHAALAQRSSASREMRELREEIQKLREGQEAMQKELQEIKRLLQEAMAGPPAPAPLEFVSADDDPFVGSAEARVVLIDFSDYQ